MRTMLTIAALALLFAGTACDSLRRPADETQTTIGSSTGSGPGTPANGGPNAMGRSGGGANN